MDPKRSPGLKEYRKNHIAGLSAGELILTTLDVGIQACEVGNMARAKAAVEELIGGLDFTYEEMSGQFLVLYDWILRLISESRFPEAQHHLLELRDTWAQVVDCEPKAKEGDDPGKVPSE